MKTQLTILATVKTGTLEETLWTAWEFAVKTGMALDFHFDGTHYIIDENSDVLALLEEAKK